jgi:hypothetical protein
MLHNQIQLTVLIKGRPITEYLHEGETFVEGREGSNFELEVHNRSDVRVEAVISVDGLSIIDGKEAGVASSGYVIDARSKVTIPGWMLTTDQVAAFVFSGKKASYAAQTTCGSAANTGVVGVMAFKEVPPKPAYRAGGFMRAVNCSAPFGGGTGDYTKGMMGHAVASTMAVGATLSNMAHTSDIAEPLDLSDVVTQSLGTGFGEATEFATQTVEFKRGDLAAMIVLYYDNAAGLRRRGIDLRQKINTKPQAFPAMVAGCTPPDGWKG